MKPYFLTQRADDDIREIYDFIYEESPQNARKVVHKLYDQFDRIADFPGIGHTRDELNDDSILVSSVYNILILYDPSINPLHILRIVHGMRNIGRLRLR